MNESCHAYKRVMSRIWTSHATHMNESRGAPECTPCSWVTSHTWTSHVTRITESCHTYERATWRTWGKHTLMSRVTRMNKSCHTCEQVISRIRMNHATSMNESRLHVEFLKIFSIVLSLLVNLVVSWLLRIFTCCRLRSSGRIQKKGTFGTHLRMGNVKQRKIMSRVNRNKCSYRSHVRMGHVNIYIHTYTYIYIYIYIYI